jgi:endonuclease YncB( thermonuclease family)
MSVLPSSPHPKRSTTTPAVVGLVAVLLVGSGVALARSDSSGQDAVTVAASASPTAESGAPEAPAVPAPEEPAAAVPEPPAPAPAPDLLTAANGGDGDSWKDTTGREYRLGLVNTPEVGECYAAEATAERKRLVASGFRADVYTTDRYGRSVSAVTSADGVDVNVHLARNGFADDRYLADYRHENPDLARQLDAAFATAKAEGAGLWGACRSPAAAAAPAPPPPAPAPPPPAPVADSGCHPAYATCIPVQGDGSGSGKANDLDCGDIRKKVQLRDSRLDPYRLDADGDGWGCESYG